MPGADIGAVAAWDITTGSTNVIVAVIDTGIRYTHQDLTNQMWRNPGESGGGKETNGEDDDGDGYKDNVFGMNAIADTNTVAAGDPMDDSVDRDGNPLGHGTHVAGTIGATANDGHPHVGVAWNVRLMACKFIGPQGGYVSDEVECFQFALAKGAHIINASYGSYFFSQTEFEALKNLRDHGVLFVAAAGNDSWNNDSLTSSYPASYDMHNIVSVAALDRFDNLADFSNYGRTNVHLGAPGVEIYSSVNASNSAYAALRGTSMAAPHVVGAAALVLSQFPNATLSELRRRVLEGAVPIPSLTNKTVTGGRLNAFNSLVAAPTGTLNVEVFPRPGSPVAAGKSATFSAVVSDLLPVTNATVTASIIAFTNLTFVDDGTMPDVAEADGVYSVEFGVPVNLTNLEVTLTVSAPGWPTTTNQFSYPMILPPPNDNFANRIPIPPSNCVSKVTGENLNASKETGEPNHAGVPGGHSVWWSWTASFTGPVRITTAESNFDTLLAVYSGQVVSNLTLIAANDDAGGASLYSSVKFDAQVGTEYQIAVDGFYTGWQGQIVLSVTPLISSITLPEAVDNPALVFTSGGDEPWLGQSCLTHDGTDAAQSGPIDANRQSWMETTIIGPGILNFWCKVSSAKFSFRSGESEDYLSFSINGAEQSHLSGELDWQQYGYWLGVGTNTLRWVYVKDERGRVGEDAGWVDELSFASSRTAIPSRFGDLDGDGQPTVLDLTLLISYQQDTNSLVPQLAVFADVNGDTFVNSNDIPVLADAVLGRTNLPAALDSDGDGILDVLESLMGLVSTETDSDGNGTPDGDEDFDSDGLPNARELQLGTDPLRFDSDGDGWWDEPEIAVGSNPVVANSRPFTMAVSKPAVAIVLTANEDFDNDGLSDSRELQLGTDPLRADSDGDGWWDEPEIAVGSNPLDANSRPFSMVVAMPPVTIELQSP